MHAHELADLAALISVHGQQLFAASPDTMDQSLSAYWKSSRCRLDRWCRSLGLLTKHGDRRLWTPDEIGLLEEILVSEILSRAVAVIAVAHDERHSKSESAPIGRNIFSGHLGVRRRVLALAAASRFSGTEDAEAILGLHRQCDRWIDLLLAYLAPYTAVDEFTASPARVRDFAYDAREHLRAGNSTSMVVTMLLGGMRSSLVPLSPVATPNADLNLQIAAALVSCFSAEYFDSFGLLSSIWLKRLRTVPNESPALLDQWWQPTASASAQSSAVRWRR